MRHSSAFNGPWIGRTAVNEFDDRRKIDTDELDRRVLDAARREQPSAELSARMAGALGLTGIGAVGGTVAGGSTSQQTTRASADAMKSAADQLTKNAGGPSPLADSWPSWVPWGASVVALAVAGAVVARSLPRAEPGTATPITASAVPPASNAEPAHEPPTDTPRQVNGVVLEPTTRAVSPLPTRPERPPNGRTPADLSAEIALMDSVRSAMATGSHQRALETLRRYESSHPNGSFRPEATALRIECLLKLGRTAEARSLAERFVVKHRGTPLADRVSRLTGLPAP